MAANKDESYEDYEIDPAAEFLAREQTQLAGLEEDLNSVVQQPSPTPITNGEKSPPNGNHISLCAEVFFIMFIFGFVM